MAKNEISTSFTLGLLGGLIGGIVAGVLFAPKSGEEIRTELKEKIIEAKEEYTPKIFKAKKETERAFDILKYRIEKQITKINSAIKARQLAKAKLIENGQDELN